MNAKNQFSLKQAIALRKSSREFIEKKQLVLLKKHLSHAANIPFYQQLPVPLAGVIDSLQALDDLAQLPFTNRSDLDLLPSQFGLADQEKITDVALTSGTSGEPVIVPYSAADLQRLAFNEAVAFWGAGVRQKDRVLLTVTLDRCFIAGLAYYSGVVLLGAAAIRSGPGQPARQWPIIEKLQPQVIVGVPTFLRELGAWGLEQGIDVAGSSVQTIVTIGEPVKRPDHSLTALGHSLKELWGAKIFSSYGATEFETAFCECGESAGGHVHPELMVVEVVDDLGNVLADGQPGEVVVTPLGVEGFPLVRFKTGDIARLYSSPCACGWNTKRLGPIEGRLKQRLKYRGTTLYPETIFHVLQDIVSVRGAYLEVRSAVDGADDITVVVGCDDSDPEVRTIEDKLQGALRVRPVVKLKKSEEVFATMMQDGGRKAKKFFDFR